MLPWIDPQNFNPGYIMRSMHLLPKRGDKPEWQHNQDYWSEKDQFPAIDLRDRCVRLRLKAIGHAGAVRKRSEPVSVSGCRASGRRRKGTTSSNRGCLCTRVACIGRGLPMAAMPARRSSRRTGESLSSWGEFQGRIEDGRLLTGRGLYVADIAVDG